MPVSEAQKRANAKYRKEKMKQITIRFSPQEMDAYDHIKSNPEGIAPYIKRLVREDMAHHSVASSLKPDSS